MSHKIAVIERLAGIERRLAAIEERMRYEYNMRQLGHDIVWDENGRCNVGGIVRMKDNG